MTVIIANTFVLTGRPIKQPAQKNICTKKKPSITLRIGRETDIGGY